MIMESDSYTLESQQKKIATESCPPNNIVDVNFN